MKSIQEFYEEVLASDELKKAFVEAVKNQRMMDFLKENGCDASQEEVQEFLEEKTTKDEPLELSKEQLKEVAGGTFWSSSYCCTKHDTCECSNTCIRDCC